MSDLIVTLKNCPDYIGAKGNDESAIADAEKKLGLRFAPDYREYLKEIGVASVGGAELTGVTNIKRLDVVSVTLEERQFQENIPLNWYVIEDTHVDGIIIWQAESKEIFMTAPNTSPKKLYNSFLEYISKTYI